MMDFDPFLKMIKLPTLVSLRINTIRDTGRKVASQMRFLELHADGSGYRLSTLTFVGVFGFTGAQEEEGWRIGNALGVPSV